MAISPVIAIMNCSVDDLHLGHRRFDTSIFEAMLRRQEAVDNYIGDKKYVSFSPSSMCESTINLGGERSRLWMLRQGKRAEEAGMIS